MFRERKVFWFIQRVLKDVLRARVVAGGAAIEDLFERVLRRKGYRIKDHSLFIGKAFSKECFWARDIFLNIKNAARLTYDSLLSARKNMILSILFFEEIKQLSFYFKDFRSIPWVVLELAA